MQENISRTGRPIHAGQKPEECARVSGIPYLMDCYREDALKILKG